MSLFQNRIRSLSSLIKETINKRKKKVNSALNDSNSVSKIYVGH